MDSSTLSCSQVLCFSLSFLWLVLFAAACALLLLLFLVLFLFICSLPQLTLLLTLPYSYFRSSQCDLQRVAKCTAVGEATMVNLVWDTRLTDHTHNSPQYRSLALPQIPKVGSKGSHQAPCIILLGQVGEMFVVALLCDH